MKRIFLLTTLFLVSLVTNTTNAQQQPDSNLNLALLPEAVLTGNISNGRGVPNNILYDPSINNYSAPSTYNEYGTASSSTNLGTPDVGNGLNWQVDWSTPKLVNYITFGGTYPNQPQPNTMWRISYLSASSWVIIDEGTGGWIDRGIYEWDNTSQQPINASAIKVELFSDGINDLVAIHLRGRGGISNAINDSSASPKATLIQLLPYDNVAPTAPTLSSSSQTDTTVNLSWTAATDNEGVTGYKIYKDEVLEATLGNVLTYQVTNLTPTTTYDFTVTAIDAAGNESNNSEVLSNITQTASSSVNIVARYKFENNVNDSKNLNNGNISGNPPYVTGIDGEAISFNNINDYITIASNSELALTELTISSLIYIPNTIQSGFGLILEHDRRGNGWYALSKSSDGNYFRFIWGNNYKANFETEINPNTWYHVVVTYDGIKAAMYLNGILDKEDNRNSNLLAISSELSIARNMDGNEAFKGVIDDLRIYDGALTSTEVSDLYNTYSFPGNNQSPTASILSNVAQTDVTVDLSWTAASDNEGVTGYKIYKDGLLEATLGNVLTYQVIGLIQNTSYNFTITAIDANGNESVFSDELNVTTNSSSGGGGTVGSGNWSLNNQDVYYNGGNVGIGTDLPDVKLEVKGASIISDSLVIGDVGGARTVFKSSTNHVIIAPTNVKTIDLDGNWNGGGFIGVYRDDVHNSEGSVNMHAHLESKAYKVNVDEFRLDGSDAKGAALLISTLQDGDSKAITGLQLNTTNSVVVIGDIIGYEKNKGYGLINKFKTKLEKDLYLSNGKIGIGVESSEIPEDYHLAVAGKIISEEVKVQLREANGLWPDYVFTKDYNLPTLKEVENQIKNKGHLENIPSAKEVKENGILLGGMNAKLLQKIEELTLYTIQQQKELDTQKDENKTLEERLAKIEVLLESIKK